VGSTETARPKGPKSEAQRAEAGEVIGEGMFPSLGRGCSPPSQVENLEERCVSFLGGVRGEALATWP